MPMSMTHTISFSCAQLYKIINESFGFPTNWDILLFPDSTHPTAGLRRAAHEAQASLTRAPAPPQSEGAPWRCGAPTPATRQTGSTWLHTPPPPLLRARSGLGAQPSLSTLRTLRLTALIMFCGRTSRGYAPTPLTRCSRRFRLSQPPPCPPSPSTLRHPFGTSRDPWECAFLLRKPRCSKNDSVTILL